MIFEVEILGPHPGKAPGYSKLRAEVLYKGKTYFSQAVYPDEEPERYDSALQVAAHHALEGALQAYLRPDT